MKSVFSKKKLLKNCKIYSMLVSQSKKKHLSFHTPGHKRKGFDITELSYSDNLACPRGVLKTAEEEIAGVLGAKKSFILTDGSTSGVYSMLKASGISSLALPENAHKSAFSGCKLLGITPVLMRVETRNGIPYPPAVYEMKGALERADALFLTSPDYYGNFPDLRAAKAFCEAAGKPLLIDGAHGGHLHFEKELYAGTFADFWVDGVHKSLPALTQGAVVSARTEAGGERLKEAAELFRTSSPSYPVMASVEYAVKYPRNFALERAAKALKSRYKERIYQNEDWTKLVVLFGKNAFAANGYFESRGIYPEFCDGNAVMFYLSPAVKISALKRLEKELIRAFERYPFLADEQAPREETEGGSGAEWVALKEAKGRIAAKDAGLFPPCMPLVKRGQAFTDGDIEKLTKASGVYGLKDGCVLVFQKESE